MRAAAAAFGFRDATSHRDGARRRARDAVRAQVGVGASQPALPNRPAISPTRRRKAIASAAEIAGQWAQSGKAAADRAGTISGPRSLRQSQGCREPRRPRKPSATSVTRATTVAPASTPPVVLPDPPVRTVYGSGSRLWRRVVRSPGCYRTVVRVGQPDCAPELRDDECHCANRRQRGAHLGRRGSGVAWS